MPLVIPDEVLHEANLSEKDAQIEIACRLFEADRLSLPAAGKLAGLNRNEMEQALRDRNIAVYRPTSADVQHDLDALKAAGI